MIEKYISSLSSLNNGQSLSVSLIFRRLLEIESFKTPDFERLNSYVQISSNLCSLQFDNLSYLLQNNERDFTLALETIFCNSDLNLFLLEKLLTDFLKDHNSKIFIKHHNSYFQRDLIFLKQFIFQQIISSSEKVLGICLKENGIKLMSHGTNVDKILNKAKRNAIKSLNILFKYVFAFKSIYEIQLSENEKSHFENFTQIFSQYLKFFLTQIHTVVTAKFQENITLSAEVYKFYFWIK